MKVTIYHNPRCSKSRQTLALLEKKGVDVNVVEYLKNPPSLTQMKKLLKMLGMKASEVVRRKEKEFKDRRLSTASEIQLVSAMSKYPVLIERPIVVKGSKAVLGRPPENVLELL